MFSDRCSRFQTDHRDVWHDTDIGAWERRWATLSPWCTCTVSLVDALDIPFVRHPDEVSYVQKMVGFLSRDLNVGDRFDWLSVCCIGRSYDRFLLTRDAADWWR